MPQSYAVLKEGRVTRTKKVPKVVRSYISRTMKFTSVLVKRRGSTLANSCVVYFWTGPFAVTGIEQARNVSPRTALFEDVLATSPNIDDDDNNNNNQQHH